MTLLSLWAQAMIPCLEGFLAELAAERKEGSEVGIMVRRYLRTLSGYVRETPSEWPAAPKPESVKQCGPTTISTLDTAELRRALARACETLAQIRGGTVNGDQAAILAELLAPVPVPSAVGVQPGLWEAKGDLL